MRMTKGVMIGLAAAALLVALAGGLALTRLNSQGDIVIGAKNFTESRVLMEIMAQLLEIDAKLTVDRRELGSTTLCYEGLATGTLNIYPEYSGTLLTDIFKQPPLSNPEEAIKKVKEMLKAEGNLRALKPFGLNDTYVLAMKSEKAKELDVAKISDLKSHPELKAGFTSEFNQREDGFPGLAKHYGLEFTSAPVDLAPGHLYAAVDGGQVDIISAFSTDARIRKFNLQTMEDDRQFFPVYQALPLIRKDVATEFPRVVEVLSSLAGEIDDETMMKLNHRVDVEGVPVKEVARQFIEQFKKENAAEPK